MAVGSRITSENLSGKTTPIKSVNQFLLTIK